MIYIGIYCLEIKEEYMKKYSRVLSKQSLENTDLFKLASEASQEIFEKKLCFKPQNMSK